ncbi:tyrosine kinase catalytic domain protein [Rhizoctonia solani AG-3 Rhs1AP]|uniref:Tyrosine kinase catalytic domain protein n=2 Tax=Rhizoctonia solani AG-3 TaxID=1086053 RepID=A0A074RNZ8_9AGAM|nr:tyrosine kinase catalytic domain protein [Rhizoctonia solani AG-3 Rhs1AP]KEP46413.1 tyrosine kinase catalytic domain protein [Rhizoctonia solani 123E]
MDILTQLTNKLFGSPKPARMGRPANETDNYRRNQEIRRRAGIEQDKQEFHSLVGPLSNQKPLPVGPSDDNPNSSSISLSRSRTPEPAVAGPSGVRPSSPADALPTQPQSLTVSRTIPVSSLSDVKSTLKSVIGIIPTSTLQDEMSDLLGCCHVLVSLLEKSDPHIVSAPHYSFIFSKMQQDLNDMTLFLTEWTRKKSAFQQMQHKGVLIQVRTLEDVFTRHLHVFIALSQSESTTAMNKEFAELQARLGTIQNHAHTRDNSDPKNTEQADPDILREQVRRITGHTPDAVYLLNGTISHREAVPVSQEKTFDVYKGKLNDGEAVAIKLLRQRLKNDGEGVRFVERIMRQVQLWSSFSSPFILECRGIGMQMTAAGVDDEYDRFQFYLVSPFMKRGNALRHIQKLRKEGAYVDILKYLRESARGIEHLHRRNPPCVHASIRGENILIKDDGTACINGFGLTKAFAIGKIIALTGANRKYHWMAPELLGQDQPPLYPSCDIWAWAMTALELISGKKPYYNVSQLHLYDHVVNQGKRPELDDYPGFEQNCPQPEKMWDLLKKCWTSASERPTIEQVITELEDIEKAQIEQQAAPHVWA